MTPYNLQELLGGKELAKLELDVLLGAANGETSRDTAARTNYSWEYVKVLRKQAIAKLYAKNIAHAVAIAVRTGLIE